MLPSSPCSVSHGVLLSIQLIIAMMESEQEKRVFVRDNIDYLVQLALDAFQIAREKLDGTVILLLILYLSFDNRPEGL